MISTLRKKVFGKHVEEEIANKPQRKVSFKAEEAPTIIQPVEDPGNDEMDGGFLGSSTESEDSVEQEQSRVDKVKSMEDVKEEKPVRFLKYQDTIRRSRDSPMLQRMMSNRIQSVDEDAADDFDTK